eukprot:3940985-Rhodomonas_salina.1
MSVGRRTNVAGTGSTSMTVQGSMVGTYGVTANVRQGHSACETTEWESDTSLRCLLAAGVRWSRRVALTVGERVGSLTESFTLDVLTVSAGRAMNRAGTGSASVTVEGGLFGLRSVTQMGRHGHTACENTRWEADTSLRCMSGGGVRDTRRVSVTAGALVSSVTQAWSADVGSLSVMKRTNRAGTGSTSVTVHGSNLGLGGVFTATTRIGHTSCEATDWEAETSIRCMISAGVRGTRRVALTVGERIGSVTQSWSHDVASMSTIRRSNRAATGSTSVTVQGIFMGLGVYTVMGAVGHSRCEGSAWESDTSVRCMVGAGIRGTRRVSLTIGGRAGSYTQGWSLDVTSMSVGRRTNRGGTGSASITVEGSSFGHLRYTSLIKVGFTSCESTDWEADTSVRCLISSAVRLTRRVSMTVGERVGTLTSAFSVDLSLSVSRRTNHQGTGSASVTVQGGSLGLVSYTQAMSISGTACESTRWEAETSVRCMMTNGVRGSRRVMVTVGEHVSTVTSSFSIDARLTSTIRGTNRAVTGSASVTVQGGLMGTSGFSGRITVGHSGCEATAWEAETSVRCLSGAGVRGTRR